MKRPIKRHVEMETLFGADFLPVSKRGAPAAAKAAPPTKAAAPAKKPGATSTFPHPWETNWPADLTSLRTETLDCTKCGLCSTRTQVVFGTGPASTPLMFVGEAPGEDEDKKGEPFVGRAGQLLTSTLKKFGVERSQVYIANILKCRPPGNRTPAPDEMASCMPWLQRQIGIVKPKLICGLGNIAVQTLLVTKTGITKLRGKLTQAQGMPFFPTFHPAYILRNMNDLPLFEADVKQALQTAGLLS